MSDIQRCSVCDEYTHMDNSENCIVCDSYFCGACDYENGERLYSQNNETYYYVCKDCLKKGLNYINEDNIDDAIFNDEEYNKAINSLKERNVCI